MKTLLFLAAGSLALTGLSACAPHGAHGVRTALDCPASQGDLQRTSIAPDQKSCVYATRDGDQVTLRLIPVSGSYQQALQSVEQELQGEVDATPASDKDKDKDKDKAKADEAAAKGEVKSAEAASKNAAAEVKTAAGEAKGAAQAARQAAEDALGDAKDAERDARGDSDGNEQAHIDLPGIHIDADEGGKADVNVGPIHVNAGENGAVIRMDRDVRLRGEAFSREKHGFRATYILANQNLKDGWSAVGYEAGGPKTGPVTIAVVKAHNGNHHDVFDDVKRLVRKNGGV